MLNFFLPPPIPQEKLQLLEPIKNIPELKSFAILLERLFLQEAILKRDITEDSGNPFYIKCKMFENIIRQICETLPEIHQPANEEYKDESQKFHSLLAFATKLKNMLIAELELNEKELNKHRNNDKENVAVAIETLTLAGCIAAGYIISPMAFIGGFLLARVADDKMESALSLTVKAATSVRLLHETILLLTTIQSSMNYRLQTDSNNQQVFDDAVLVEELPQPPEVLPSAPDPPRKYSFA